MTRPSRGMKLTVHIGKTESEQWGDTEFRRAFLKTIRAAAAAKNRRYYEIFDENGVMLRAGAVDA